jgi:dTDP-L-rhamnose 4-epimerase
MATTQRVVVTGASGKLGRFVVQHLVDSGYAVVATDRVAPPSGSPGKFTIADLTDLGQVIELLSGVDEGHAADAVVHLAAKVGLGVGIDDIDDYVASNDLGTAVLLRAAAERAPHVVYASSMVVYGEGAYRCAEHGGVHPPPRSEADLSAGLFDPRCPSCGRVLVPGLVAEDAPLDPRNVYAATKAHGERLLAVWTRATGASATALRFHNVYGPGMPRDTPYAGVASIFRSEAEHGRPPRVFEDGGQRRDLVHVDDVAAAVRAAVERPQGAGRVEAFNVGSGTVTTIGEVARRVAALLGAPEPVVTGEWRAGDVRHVTASSERAGRVLGWQAAVGLDDGLAELVGAAQGGTNRAGRTGT